MSGFLSAGLFDAIPDSAIYWWDPADFSTASDWTDQAQSEVMTINTDPQEATFIDGSPAVSPDGTDDIGLATQSDIWNTLNTFSFEMELQYTTASRVMPMGMNAGGPRIYFEINSDGEFNNVEGDIAFYLHDDNGNRLDINAGTSNLNDGNKHKVSVIVSDASNNNIEIVVDGTTESTTPVTAGSPSSFTDPNQDVGYFARWDGSAGVYYPGLMGKIAWHDIAISGQTI